MLMGLTDGMKRAWISRWITQANAESRSDRKQAEMEIVEAVRAELNRQREERLKVER